MFVLIINFIIYTLLDINRRCVIWAFLYYIFQGISIILILINIYVYYTFIFICCILSFSSSYELFTHSSISSGVVSSGNYSMNFFKISQLIYFSFSVISLCITPSFILSAVSYFSSSSSSFTNYYI